MPRKVDPDRLLDAAAEAFGHHGYFRTRVSDVAGRAGVAQGTIYLHFPSKEHLYLAVLDRFADSVRRISESIRWEEIRSTADLHERFADLYTETFELCARNRDVAALALSGPSVGRSGEIRTRLIGDAERISVAYLEAGAARGLLRPLPAETVARAIVGLLIHTATTTIVAEGRTAALRELAEELLDFELHGLLASGQATRGHAQPAMSAHETDAAAQQSPEG